MFADERRPGACVLIWIKLMLLVYVFAIRLSRHVWCSDLDKRTRALRADKILARLFHASSKESKTSVQSDTRQGCSLRGEWVFFLLGTKYETETAAVYEYIVVISTFVKYAFIGPELNFQNLFRRLRTRIRISTKRRQLAE